MLCVLALSAVSTLLYILYVNSAPHGPTGGSWQGMAFGIAGSGLMLYAGLLAVRKKLPRWRRLGTAQTWLRGHIWLGLFSVLLILFHAGFRLGGFLEKTLMLVLALVILSGVVGLLLQIYLPRLMKVAVPAEAIYEQIPAACAALCRTADENVQKVCGSLLAGANPAVVTVTTSAAGDDNGDVAAPLREFYREAVRPFLAADYQALSRLPYEARQLASGIHAAAAFEQVRIRVPHNQQETIENLEQICDERRQLMSQQRMHRWLHTWLLIHIPLSVLLLALGLLHAYTAVYY